MAKKTLDSLLQPRCWGWAGTTTIPSFTLDGARDALASTLSSLSDAIDPVRADLEQRASALVEHYPQLKAVQEHAVALLAHPQAPLVLGTALVFVLPLVRRSITRRMAYQPTYATYNGGQRRAQGQSSKADYGEIELLWGRERYTVPLPPPTAPLSALKAQIAQITGVPVAHQKLITHGGTLKDDLALSAYGLVDEPSLEEQERQRTGGGRGFWESWGLGSLGEGGRKKKLKKVQLIGSVEGPNVTDHLRPRGGPPPSAPESARATPEPEDEPGLIAKIQTLRRKAVDEVRPQLATIEAYLAAPETAEAPHPRLAIFLSEQMLQSLLKLDGIEVQPGWNDARKERKEAVREVQSVLDRLDEAKDGMRKLAAATATATAAPAAPGPTTQ